MVQRIYQHYKGFSVVDELRDMRIDGVCPVEFPVCGLPYGKKHGIGTGMFRYKVNEMADGSRVVVLMIIELALRGLRSKALFVVETHLHSMY
ncbi:hypothetical protein ACF3MZ_18145 [Paenibacillaceae bacterium WGS1546]|uniref:hypothetical protein n=1 Tax=Cohnella sp. WGS1546 TaxID=3366810 RepID=UPI00372D549B